MNNGTTNHIVEGIVEPIIVPILDYQSHIPDRMTPVDPVIHQPTTCDGEPAI